MLLPHNMALWRKSWSTRQWQLDTGVWYEMKLTKLSHNIRNENVLEEWTYTGLSHADGEGNADEGKGDDKGSKGSKGFKGEGKGGKKGGVDHIDTVDPPGSCGGSSGGCWSKKGGKELKEPEASCAGTLVIAAKRARKSK